MFNLILLYVPALHSLSSPRFFLVRPILIFLMYLSWNTFLIFLVNPCILLCRDSFLILSHYSINRPIPWSLLHSYSSFPCLIFPSLIKIYASKFSCMLINKNILVWLREPWFLYFKSILSTEPSFLWIDVFPSTYQIFRFLFLLLILIFLSNGLLTMNPTVNLSYF